MIGAAFEPSFAPAEAVRKSDGQAVWVYGTADAKALKSVRLGDRPRGGRPGTGRQLGSAQKKLATWCPRRIFRPRPAQKVWQIRVIVTHETGTYGRLASN